jgi:2'-5' RNA ligase
MDMRLFVAMELDHPGKRAVGKLIERLGRPLAGQPGKVRWVGPEQMHLTLAFLGDTPDGRVPEVVAAMERAAGGIAPFPFGLAGVGAFPDSRRPRVIWVGVTEPTGALTRLQASLARELAGLGFTPEDRDFHPHITLGRVKEPDRRADYEACLAAQRDFAWPGQSADKLLLIRSELGSSGPTYTTVAAAALGGG